MKSHEFINELNIDNQEGWGQTPNNANIDYLGLRVQMLPEVFLMLASYLPTYKDYVKQNIETMKKHQQEGGTFGAPMLYITVPDGWLDEDFSKEARVSGHEGRHRMNVHLELEGNTPVETHIIINGGWRHRYGKDSDYTPEVIKHLNEWLINESGNIKKGPFFRL